MLLNKLVASSCLLAVASAWHYEVHNQVGFVAEKFMTPNAQWVMAQILGNEYGGSIGKAAHWADMVSKTTHKYSYNWHWISAHDDPPNYCNVHYFRDCPLDVSCAVGQLNNQTQILSRCIRRLRDGDLGRDNPDVDCQQALKWVVHFTGDLAEPMHTSYRDYGGNTFKVKFNNTETNMHQTWDRWIIYAILGQTSFSQESIDPYFQRLVERIDQDGFPTSRASWIKDLDWYRPWVSAMAWARDTNEIVCDVAYGKYVNGSDLYLDGDYTKVAWWTIEQQLAKAGYRLGNLMNSLTDAFYGRGVEPLADTMIESLQPEQAEAGGGMNKEALYGGEDKIEKGLNEGRLLLQWQA